MVVIFRSITRIVRVTLRKKCSVIRSVRVTLRKKRSVTRSVSLTLQKMSTLKPEVKYIIDSDIFVDIFI